VGGEKWRLKAKKGQRNLQKDIVPPSKQKLYGEGGVPEATEGPARVGKQRRNVKRKRASVVGWRGKGLKGRKKDKGVNSRRIKISALKRKSEQKCAWAGAHAKS